MRRRRLSCRPGIEGPAFIAYPNFKAVLAYNNAISYALAICELSVRFRGGPDFVKPWPRDERPILSRTDRVELQTLLALRKYDVGEPDGVIGRRTREAIRAFQRSQGLPADGFPTLSLLQRLRQRRRRDRHRHEPSRPLGGDCFAAQGFGDGLDARCHAELLLCVFDVEACRARADAEFAADFGVGVAVRGEAQAFGFARRQQLLMARGFKRDDAREGELRQEVNG